MSETEMNTGAQKSNLVGYVLVGLLVIAAVGVLVYENQSKDSASVTTEETIVAENTTQESSSMEETAADSAENDSQFVDGEYTVTGEYTSPGGPETIEVTLEIEDDIIVDSEVIGQATLPMSKEHQEEFIQGYEEFVIGKSLDEVTVNKVAGASLTPKGFNDAVQKIKEQATS